MAKPTPANERPAAPSLEDYAELLTLAEAGEICGRSYWWVYRNLVGETPVVEVREIGGRRYIPKASLRRWLETEKAAS